MMVSIVAYAGCVFWLSGQEPYIALRGMLCLSVVAMFLALYAAWKPFKIIMIILCSCLFVSQADARPDQQEDQEPLAGACVLLRQGRPLGDAVALHDIGTRDRWAMWQAALGMIREAVEQHVAISIGAGVERRREGDDVAWREGRDGFRNLLPGSALDSLRQAERSRHADSPMLGMKKARQDVPSPQERSSPI